MPFPKSAILGLILIGGIALAAPPRAPRLVWNATASAPRGLYFLFVTREFHRGDLVLAVPPAWVRDLAARRGYLPADVPLIKRIAASAEDRVCSDGIHIRVNSHIAAVRLPSDARHRPLPQWTGCTVLDSHHDFLLMEGVPASFDGRYFGPTPIANNLGRLAPIWTF